MLSDFNNIINLGTTLTEKGCSFSIFLKNVEELYLNFYEKNNNKNVYRKIKLYPELHKIGNIWNIFVEGIKEGEIYAWELNGKTILDPYALAFTESEIVEEKRSIVVAPSKGKEKHLLKQKKDMIIYEVHIGLFTKNSNSNTKSNGTFSAFQEKIPYLKDLGINTVEFLPVFEWEDSVGNSSSPLKHLKNVWGYNPINFFALTKKFATDKNTFSEIQEFRDLVAELHKNDIEVILDVVYNHSAEKGNGEKGFNFKLIDENIFYIKDKNNEFANYSGCGNTINANNEIVKDMIIQSLLYWYLEMGIDGFRFDLASILGRDSDGQWLEDSILKKIAEHPILSEAKLIAESWDLGGVFVGSLPNAWSEWNGAYRDTVRKFIRGDYGQIPELIKRIFGSVDIFHSKKDKYQSSINFICAHDGFTMWDLVSYNKKYNLTNGEENRDGENNNNSYNHGEEGETKNLKIINLRKQQMKNMLLILFISQGIPMLLMGDEIARTQYGNNNAYCQDNRTTWFDWSRKEKFEDIFEFTKNIINIRNEYSIFKKDNILSFGEEIILHGVNLFKPDFEYHSLSIAFQLKDKEKNADFYIALNSYIETLNFELPHLENGKSWYLLTDTSNVITSSFKKIKWEEKFYPLNSKSSVLFISK